MKFDLTGESYVGKSYLLFIGLVAIFQHFESSFCSTGDYDGMKTIEPLSTHFVGPLGDI